MDILEKKVAGLEECVELFGIQLSRALVSMVLKAIDEESLKADLQVRVSALKTRLQTNDIPFHNGIESGKESLH